MATRTNSSFTKPLIVLAIGLATAMAVGCGDDDNSDNTPAGGTKASTGGGGSGGNGGTSSKAGNGGTSTKAGSSNGGTDTMGGGGAGPETMGGEAGMGGAPDCTDDADMGCYKCAPKTLTQFLNACPTTGCEPFDNKTLTSFAGGKLPKLP